MPWILPIYDKGPDDFINLDIQAWNMGIWYFQENAKTWTHAKKITAKMCKKPFQIARVYFL